MPCKFVQTDCFVLTVDVGVLHGREGFSGGWAMAVFRDRGYVDLSKLVRVSELRFAYQNPNAEFTWRFVGAHKSDTIHVPPFDRECKELVAAQKILYPGEKYDSKTPESLKAYQDELVRLHEDFIQQWLNFQASRTASGLKIIELLERDPSATYILAEMLDKLTSYGR